MPGISGLEVAKSLQNKQIIFTTAYKEFAAEAFDLDAIDYIRKPIQKERLEKAIEKALAQINLAVSKEKRYLQLNTDKGKTLLYYNKLHYIKTSDIDSRDKIAVLSNGTTLTLKNISFKELEKQLPESNFIRINKQEIISLKIVGSYTADAIMSTILLSSGLAQTFTLSDIYRNAFIRKMNA